MRRSGVLVASVALLASAALAPSAWGHADLVRSEPVVGSTLANPPPALRLEFNEDVSQAQVQLLDGSGLVVGGTHLATSEGSALVLEVPHLPRDSYQLVWHVLSADDGHVSNGMLSFGVRTAPEATGGSRSAGDAGSPLEATLRWLDFLMLAGMVGGVAIAAVLSAAAAAKRAPADVVAAARHRVLRLAAACAGLALALGGLLFVWEAVDLRSTLAADESLMGGAATLLSERWGALWVARELLLAALASGLLLARRRSASGARGRAGAWLAAGLLLAVSVVRAAAGHAAAAGDDGLAIGSDALHQLAAGAWIGGVFAFVVAVWSVNGLPGTSATQLARACWGPFAVLVGLSVVVVGITGLHAAGVEVASVDGLLTTFYGGTLIAKTALVALVAVFGVVSALLLRRMARGRAAVGLLRLLLAEAAIGVMVLVGAALMTSSSPPRGPEFSAPRAAPTPTLSAPVGDLLVSATARPNRPGTNILTVLAASSRRPPPAPIDRITARLRPAGPGAGDRVVPLTKFAPNRFSGGTRLARQGRWRMTVVVHRSGERLVSHFGWALAPPDPARPIEVSAKPLAPVLDRVALFGLIGLAALGLSLIVVRRLRRRAKPQVDSGIARADRAATAR